ncbi:MAG: type I DNA topoisomerase [Hyphomicrobiaceae bacterium]|nr:type I DNA topoisomerase [Hyphomicrobiaceae bacterium]
MNVVIVESAAKAKTINKYLGSSFKVIASFGHVRDLPPKDGSVKPDADFEMAWDVEPRSAKIMSEIAKAVKGADKLILATDPDREGEAISWHILEILNQKKVLKGVAIERVAFNAITKQAITEALAHPRQIDEPLVDAYLARRALDYLVGFTLSPVLWRKLPGARSAGRVQSVALRLVCDREDEIERFKTDEYWTIEATLAKSTGETFPARLFAIDGETLKKLDIKDGETANRIKAAIDGGRFTIERLEKKQAKRNPYAPFATSTLQMDASRKLGFSAKQTMQIAQRLYEGVDIGGETVGLITYMRTDGVQIVPEAVQTIRGLIAREYSQRYVAPFVREYKTKAKNAQEAHEAIRPTDVGRRPQDVARALDRDQARLYELIWKRAVASQMASAELEQTSADIIVAGRDGKRYMLRATGSVVTFDGFLKVYEEGRDDRVRVIDKGKDDAAEDGADDRRLPPLAEGESLTDRGIEAEQHFTQPPPRYSEATLVKRMEELGIGRPSTYASTLAVLQEREYVRIDKKRLIPEDKGRIVTAFLTGFFRRYVEYDFTAELEEKLDLISDDKLDWKTVLRDFWRDFMGAVDGTRDLTITQVLDALNDMLGPHIFPVKDDGGDPRACPACGVGQLSLKMSRQNGAFIGCSNYNSEASPCRYTRQLSQSGGEDGGQVLDGKSLGIDEKTGLGVTIRSGRFGTYLQLGEASDYEAGEKPRRSSIPKGIEAASIDLEMALKLLNLPREVGPHPEGGTILAGLGRFGPFIVHENGKDKTYVNLDSMQDVFDIQGNRAVVLLAEKKAGGGKSRFQRGPQVLRDLGEHPELSGPVQILAGRYGPYIAHNKVYANVPKGQEPDAVGIAEAVALLAERAAKGGGKPARKASSANGKAKPTAKSKTKSKAPASTPRSKAAAGEPPPKSKPLQKAAAKALGPKKKAPGSKA